MSRIPINENDPNQQSEQSSRESGEAQDLPDELRQLQSERDDLYDRLARVTADFKNSQRRLQADFEQSVQFANSTLIKNLLPVIDNFERALAVEASSADAASILKGMQIVHDQWLNVLKSQDVQTIAPEAGTPFDPTKHEAMMQQPTDDYDQPRVTQLFRKGYSLHERTLRPAQVAVSCPAS